MRKHYSYGMDPVDLAKILKKAIENEVFLALPFDDPQKMLRDNFERLINYLTPEGMKRQAEAQAKRQEEMKKNPNPMMQGADEAGWAKARPDIDWVDESVRPNS
jgi:hypothetical protein